MEKKKKREFLLEFKEETLLKDAKLISKYSDLYTLNESTLCDLSTDPVKIHFCESSTDKQKWKAFVHKTTSIPYRGAVGRQVKLFVTCGEHIVGMVHLTSPLAQSKVRDAYLNFEDKWAQLKGIYNIETCVPIRRYANLLTGKLLVYAIFSNAVSAYLEDKYDDKVLGFETTSLYGKSSMYNRLPFLKYLGLTEGLSAVYISDAEWKQILDEYNSVYPNTKTNRLAPVKFQIVDKLSKYYKKIGKEFPYTYKSASFKRGVYFGYCRNISLEDSVTEWRNRWYYKRLNSLMRG